MMQNGKFGKIQIMKIQDIDVYKGKKVLVTGHTGFKGSWLIKILNLLGADIKGYALVPKTANDLYWLINGDKICESIIADLRDRVRLIKEIKDFQPDFIFHLAAQPLVRLSYEIPAETFEINAIGTANLLDGVRNLEKKCQIILITTDKVYYNNEWDYPYRENDRLGGYDPYSASKACAELVIDSYRNSFFNTINYQQHYKAIAVARAGNVIGGGDWSADRLLPDIAKAIGNNNEIIVRNPFSVRPWQHVLEPLVGYLLLGARLEVSPVEFSGAFNFGPYPEDVLTVEEMVKLAISCWGKGSHQNQLQQKQPHEASLLKLDISKAAIRLGWRPTSNTHTAVKMTMDWYKSFYQDKSHMEKFTEEQISNFILSYV